MIRKKAKKRGRKKLEMVRKSDYLKLKEALIEADELVEKLQEIDKQKENYFSSRTTQLEHNLADAHEEQQRLFTVISSLGQTIQNLERINKNRNSSRDFRNLQAESTTNQLLT